MENWESNWLWEIRRLMIFTPPRHGKSALASKAFPAWFLGLHPDKQIISASYNSELANDFGRAVRNLVATDEYRCLFPAVTLASDSQAANRWHTNHGGAYLAAGVGTAITGRGAHVALIDDPIKDWQEASSETIRRRVWEWYTSTLYTRLMPGGSIILIMTRWFEDDLAGRLLADREQMSGNWEILAMPALSDQGNALWPEWFPVERLDEIRQSIGSRHWQALYQQQPAAEGGEVLRREWFRIEPQHTFPKKYDDIVQIWDTAFKEGAENDFAVCLTLAAAGGNFYVLDLLCQRWSGRRCCRPLPRSIRNTARAWCHGPVPQSTEDLVPLFEGLPHRQ